MKAEEEKMMRILIYYYCYPTKESQVEQVPKYCRLDFSDIYISALKYSVMDSR